MKAINFGESQGGGVLHHSDEEKLSQIFMILFEKNVAERSANDFENS